MTSEREDVSELSAMEHQVWENRLRRAAERQGLVLRKSRRRDSRAKGYGTYSLVDATTGTIVCASDSTGYGMTLAEIEEKLNV